MKTEFNKLYQFLTSKYQIPLTTPITFQTVMTNINQYQLHFQFHLLHRNFKQFFWTMIESTNSILIYTSSETRNLKPSQLMVRIKTIEMEKDKKKTRTAWWPKFRHETNRGSFDVYLVNRPRIKRPSRCRYEYS